MHAAQAFLDGDRHIQADQLDVAGIGKYWRQLHKHVPVDNRVRAFAARLLHGALVCDALHASVRGVTERCFSYCKCCEGQDATNPHRRARDTYSHVLFHCPMARPAVVWLCDLWQELSKGPDGSGGARPPDTVEAIVTDQPGAWPAASQPKGARMLLWQALRLTLLYRIWSARCSTVISDRTARAIVTSTISDIRTMIRTCFGQAFLRKRMAAALPRHVLARLSNGCPRAAFHVWEHPLLVSVQNGSEMGASPPVTPQSSQQPPHLTILLTDVLPVPAPPLQPPATTAAQGAA